MIILDGFTLTSLLSLVEGEWVENSKIRISYENWCQANGYEPKKAR
jgi:hypothetical protein